MKILSIDTSCDETAAAVTEGVRILSNIVWSQASLHAKWGGVVPSLAKRQHEERIDWVIAKALESAKCRVQSVGAIAITLGPGLAIALEVGINKAKEISKKFKKPLIAVNHIEGHLLSPLAQPKNSQQKTNNQEPLFPSLGIVASGGHTEIVFIKEIGDYKTVAQTVDDALGESLDKAARLLGLGYPGGAILEKIAKEGNPLAYPLPLPLKDDKLKNRFSFSGLKTAFVRQVATIKNPTKKQIADLAASFQNAAFQHLIDVTSYQIRLHNSQTKGHPIFAGGGVVANITLRKMLRKLCRQHNIKILFPYSKRLYTDNAAIIGIAAYFSSLRGGYVRDINLIDRKPRASVDQKIF